MNKLQILGSNTAKSGFRNEKLLVDKFNNYSTDCDAKYWLEFMGYKINNIQKLKAYVIPAGTKNIENLINSEEINEFKKFHRFSKADLQVQIEIIIDNIIYRENISAKSTKSTASFNQIDKRKVSTYKEMWNIPDDVSDILECFTGQKSPFDLGYTEKDMIISKGSARITSSTMHKLHVEKILNFFNSNKYMILSDIIIGRGPLKADFMIITTDENKYDIFRSSEIINHFCNFDFEKGTRTTFLLGNCFSMQRKGGTPDPESLQFKFKPNKIISSLKWFEW
ncbi:MAG: hypothetical protein ACRCUP_01350 [Mycoplasmatales bacterium]